MREPPASGHGLGYEQAAWGGPRRRAIHTNALRPVFEHAGYSIMSNTETFDCLMSHNGKDESAARRLATILRDRHISVWSGDDCLRPGMSLQESLETVIPVCRAVVVVIGASGLGPWEEEELRGVTWYAVAHRIPVIPVLLPEAPAEAKLSVFLKGRTWVDMRVDVASDNLSRLDKSASAMERLIWGITGVRPYRQAPRSATGGVDQATEGAEGQDADRESRCRSLLKSCRDDMRLLQEKVNILEETEESLKAQIRRLVDETYAGRGALRDQVFFSYSHKDLRWLQRLKAVLEPAVRNAKIDSWDDTLIKPGEHWQEKIQDALSRAKVAVLLVSPDFLASEFIVTKELPELLNAQESMGVTVLWVPIRDALVEHTPIWRYQSVIAPNRSLSSLQGRKRDQALVTIARVILDAYAA